MRVGCTSNAGERGGRRGTGHERGVGWGIMHTPVRIDLRCCEVAHPKFGACGLLTWQNAPGVRVFFYC